LVETFFKKFLESIVTRGFARVVSSTGSVKVTTVLVDAFNSCARSNCQFPSPINAAANAATPRPARMRSYSLIRFFLATFLHTGVALIEAAH
jgi:hypothetical protein